MNKLSATFSFSFMLLIAGILLCESLQTVQAQAVPPQFKPIPKSQIMILGVNHFVSQNDYRNSKKLDTLSGKKQKEIREVLDHLRKFKPTKIAVEASYGDAKINERYKEYLGGKYTLTANEIDQLGYRLAKDLNHKQLYPVDYKMTLDIDGVIQYAKANGQESVIATIENDLSDLDRLKRKYQARTLLEQLRATNSLKAQNLNHQMYLESLKIGKDSVYVGADMTGDWYKRNLKIFANLTRIADASGGDRILLIIGVGHCKILREVIRDSPDYQLVEAEKYL